MTSLKTISAIMLLTSTALLSTACSSHKVKPESTTALLDDSHSTQTSNHDSDYYAQEPSHNSDIEPELMVESSPLHVEPIPADPAQAEYSDATDDIAEAARPAKSLFHFGFDQPTLDDENQNIIKQHAEFLAQHPSLKITISGHADQQGDPIYNEQLSQKRAQHVADILQQQGIPANQIEVQSWGANNPASAATHHKDNRRVELIYNEEYLVNNEAH